MHCCSFKKGDVGVTQTQIADLNVWGDNTSHHSLHYNIALKTWIFIYQTYESYKCKTMF